MKRILVTIFMVLLCAATMYAQFYVKAGAGYALSSGSVLIDRDRIFAPTGIETYTYHYGTFGQGLEFAGAVGYSFTPSVAGELGVVYNLGPEYEAKDVRQNPAQNQTATYSGSMLSFSPALVVTGQAWNLKPYARFGIVIGFPSYEEKVVQPASTSTDTYSGGMLVGFQGALGVTFPLTSSLTMFAEATLLNGSWSPTKREERRGATTTAITLKDQFTDVEQFVDAQPAIPFGSFGLRAGLRLPL